MATLTATVAEMLKSETLAFIKENEEEYALPCMLEFIREYNEEDFVQFYDVYIEQGERIGYAVCDAFIEEEGIVNIEHVEDAFMGYYDTIDAFVEEHIEEVAGVDLPVWICVDYAETWRCSLQYDYTFTNGMVFRRDY